MSRKLLILLVLLLAACGGQSEEPRRVVTVTPVTAPPPTLLAPADVAQFDNVAGVVLEWQWIRPLRAGEYYDVRVWREGEPNYGITWTRDTSFSLTDWLLNLPEPGEFFWSIAVIEGQDGQLTRELTAQAEPRSFTVAELVLPVVAAIQVPPGFVAEEYGRIFDARTENTAMTVITFHEGKLYILTLDGRIFTLEDTTGDHMGDTLTRIYDNEDRALNYVSGMDFRDGLIYLSDAGRIVTLADTSGDGLPDTLTPIVEGLPALRYIWHSNNGITFGPDDRLYIAVGATTDHGPVTEEYEGAILRVNPDGSELEVFASGFRNPYALVFSPDGDLFTADNGPDYGPEDVPEEERYEELNHVREGHDYGFPTWFGHPREDDGTTGPVVEFTPHVAVAGLEYYAADHFPEHYRGGIFVAHWGATPPFEAGREVVFVRLEPTDDGSFTGEVETFATFAEEARPVDVVVGPDGALYIAEWTRGIIYRVVYTGP